MVSYIHFFCAMHNWNLEKSQGILHLETKLNFSEFYFLLVLNWILDFWNFRNSDLWDGGLAASSSYNHCGLFCFLSCQHLGWKMAAYSPTRWRLSYVYSKPLWEMVNSWIWKIRAVFLSSFLIWLFLQLFAWIIISQGLVTLSRPNADY